jgi:hypothetical protein
MRPSAEAEAARAKAVATVEVFILIGGKEKRRRVLCVKSWMVEKCWLKERMLDIARKSDC